MCQMVVMIVIKMAKMIMLDDGGDDAQDHEVGIFFVYSFDYICLWLLMMITIMMWIYSLHLAHACGSSNFIGI